MNTPSAPPSDEPRSTIRTDARLDPTTRGKVDDLAQHFRQPRAAGAIRFPETAVSRLWGIGSEDRLIFDNFISVQVSCLPPRCRADSVASGGATDPQSPKRGFMAVTRNPTGNPA